MERSTRFTLSRRLVRIQDTAKIPGFPLAIATLYAWRTRRRHPEIFTTVGRSVFVDLDAMDNLIERGRGGAGR